MSLTPEQERMIANTRRYENAKDELIVQLSVAVEHILRKIDRFWPEDRGAISVAEKLSDARKNFSDSR